MAIESDHVAAQDVAVGVGDLKEPAADPKRWGALLVLLVAAFLDMLDSTIANVAAPSVQADLGAGYSAVQWLLVGYQLSFALLLILGGRLGDIFGRKKMFLTGVAGFTVASLLSGISQEPWQLVAARVLQGACAGIMVPQILSIIHVTFPEEERGKAFALYGGIAGIAAAFGLALGGILVQWNLFGLDWRLIFLINVPIGIFGLVKGSNNIAESKAPQALKLDVAGVLLATLGLVMLVFPLLQGRELGWPTWGFVSMVLSLPVLLGFVAYQKYKTRKDGSPLVALNLFKNRSYVSGLGVQLSFLIGVGMFNIGWTLYMQLGQGWTPMHAGLSSLPFCIGAFLTSAMSVMVLVPKFGRKVLQFGVVLVIAGLLSYLWIAGHYGHEIHSWQMAPSLLVIGLGFGMVAAPLPDIVTSEVPFQDAGSASGVVNTNFQLGFVIGGALISVVFFGGLASNTAGSVDDLTPKLRQDLAAVHVAPDQVGPAIASFKACSVDRAKEKDPAVVPASCTANPVLRSPEAAGVFQTYGEASTGDSFAKSFQTTMWTFIGVAALSFLLMFAIPRGLRTQGAGAPAAG